jgi:peptidylprolyl isomerase
MLRCLLTALPCLLLAHSLAAAPDAPATAELKDGLYVEITTEPGVIVAELYYKRVPMTVINFVSLVEGTRDHSRTKTSARFYDGLKFHRVISNFMIQGGCPNGNGRGGPGYKFADEFHPDLVHSGPGILSMANAGPGTNGSQFFITHKTTDYLDCSHSVFGKVVSGLDVVNAVQKGHTMTMKIIRVGDDATAFKTDKAAFDAIVHGRETAAARKKQDHEAFGALAKRRYPGAQAAASGMWYKTVKAGAGAKPKKGSTVFAHYTGKLLTGQTFDSSKGRSPFSFPLGQGRVIKGWDEALADMQKGEVRALFIPPEMAYGARGSGRRIPPNAWLFFEVELVDFK